MRTTSWRKELKRAVANTDQMPLIHCTLTQEELDYEFDPSYGAIEGSSFTAWSDTRVYFPVCYDGSEWVESVPRYPCFEVTDHIGGG